jgi:hypothetical protein
MQFNKGQLKTTNLRGVNKNKLFCHLCTSQDALKKLVTIRVWCLQRTIYMYLEHPEPREEEFSLT